MHATVIFTAAVAVTVKRSTVTVVLKQTAAPLFVLDGDGNGER